MKRLIIPSILVPIVLVLLIGITTANAQHTNDPAAPRSDAATALSAGYDLSWYTIDGGGATFSTGGSYSLGGSIGQPDAGSLSGGSYHAQWWVLGRHVDRQLRIYLPLVRK